MNLKELAQKLGLSPTTVSRALNGYPEVNEATRTRVMAAAKRHNYHPNTRAIRLYARGVADAILEGRSQVITEMVAPAASAEEFVEVEDAEEAKG